MKTCVAEIVSSELLDKIIASQDQGTSVRRALKRVRKTLISPHVTGLNVSDKLSIAEKEVMAQESPLQYAKATFNQDFLQQDIDTEFKRGVCMMLVSHFGDRGNPIWKHYLAGTFQYISAEDLEDQE